MIFRLIQLLDFLFLLFGKFIFFLIKHIQEHQQDTCQHAHQHNGRRRIEKRTLLRILQNQFRKVESNIVAKQCFYGTKDKKECLPFPHQRNADIDKAQHEPLRHTAVKPACRKKAERKNQQQQYRDDGCSAVDTAFFNAELRNSRNHQQAHRQQRQVVPSPAQRQYENQRKHTGACRHTEHAFPQTNSVVKYNFQPFL